MISNIQHWDSVFSRTSNQKLGWYENNASKTISLLEQIPNWKDLTVFIPGAGTSILIDELISQGVNLILNDISHQALTRSKNKFKSLYKNIYWLQQDISKPIQVAITDVDIWIDRAVLHFLNDSTEIDGYFNNLNSTLKIGGYAIFAEFSKIGAYKCAGLPIHQYDVRELSERLGSNFEIMSYFNHVYTNPDGETKPYIYTLFKRVK